MFGGSVINCKCIFIDLLAGAYQEQKSGEEFVLKVKGESVNWFNSHWIMF